MCASPPAATLHASSAVHCCFDHALELKCCCAGVAYWHTGLSCAYHRHRHAWAMCCWHLTAATMHAITTCVPSCEPVLVHTHCTLLAWQPTLIDIHQDEDTAADNPCCPWCHCKAAALMALPPLPARNHPRASLQNSCAHLSAPGRG
jgi:hypothetical protein